MWNQNLKNKFANGSLSLVLKEIDGEIERHEDDDQLEFKLMLPEYKEYYDEIIEHYGRKEIIVFKKDDYLIFDISSIVTHKEIEEERIEWFQQKVLPVIAIFIVVIAILIKIYHNSHY